ncbi:TetR/AcrR family transcriptional regulator [Timonella sp. A28]|uniref:TetR/AcrR family transcriptional regulator n=1 Tax=Timonella sp. A28 TaxID=3442640 RepID=UPI003EB795D2
MSRGNNGKDALAQPEEKVLGRLTSPREPGTMYESGRRRREEILAAAFEHFAEFGYHGASMREIAASTGVTHAGLRYHFPSKDDLLLAVLEKRSSLGDRFFEDPFGESFENLEHQQERVWEVIEAFVDFMRFSFDRLGMIQLFTTQAIYASDPDYPAHEFYVRRYDKMRDDYRRALVVIQEFGILKPELCIDHVSIEIIAFLEGLQVQWLLQPEKLDYVSALEHYFKNLIVVSEHEHLSELFSRLQDEENSQLEEETA